MKPNLDHKVLPHNSMDKLILVEEEQSNEISIRSQNNSFLDRDAPI